LKNYAVNFLQTNPLLNDRVRLSIMGVLASSEFEVSFNELKNALNLTKGNLSAHIKKLEKDELVKVKKTFIDNKPRTTYVCSIKGRKALNDYLKKVEELLRLSK